MEWDPATRERLEIALNESEVVGVRLEPVADHVDVLLHVDSLPATGPLVRDGRRILRLARPGELRFLLRPDTQPLADQPAVPLADLDAVEDFFASLTWDGAMYGWRFLDDPGRTADWPSEVSLHHVVRDEPAAHLFRWFNECGVVRDDEAETFCFEGTVTFDDLAVLDASGDAIPVGRFVEDGVRQWEAFFAHDPRLSADAQQEAHRDAPRWRRRPVTDAHDTNGDD